MANLLNSMVRGFGGQIGRTAANRMMYSTPQKGKQWVIALLLLTTFICGMGWLYSIGKNDINTKQNTVIDSTKSVTETYNGHAVYTGKKGGKYYYSKNGKKVYF